MSKLKLLTNKKVIKYPSFKRGIESTFRRALDKAKKNGAIDVIIISRDKGGCDVSASHMTMYQAMGIMKRAEIMLTEDNW